MSDETCQSCGMPMHHEEDHAPGNPTSVWCRYCSNEDGSLQDFDERLRRTAQWSVRKDGADPATAEARAREYMRSMPVWRDHPALRS